MLWRLRAPKTGDIGFVFNAFLKSFRDAPVNKGMTHTVYYREMHAVIERALLRPSIRIVIACDPSEEDMIYGFGIGEVIDSTLCLHYIYVKHSFRQFGIGRALEAELHKLPHTDRVYTCAATLSPKLLRTHPYTYNPFLLWGKM